jgi:hypothetical protein
VVVAHGERLAPGATRSLTFEVASADSLVVGIAGIGVPLASVTLTGPSPAGIPEQVWQDSIQVSVFRVSTPAAGTWQVGLTAAAASSDSVDVLVVGRTINGVAVVDSLWVTGGPSTQLNLRAEVTSSGVPSPSAAVRVLLLYDSGARDSLDLVDDGLHDDGAAGDGSFGGSTAPPIPNDIVSAYFRVAPGGTLGSGVEIRSLRKLQIGDRTPPSITLRAPVTGALWTAGSIAMVTWSAYDGGGLASFEVRLSTDGGSGFPYLVGMAGAADTSVAWTVPSLSSDSCRVLVRAVDLAGNVSADTSRGLFRVANYSPVGVGGGSRVLRFALAQNAPNPFRDRTEITLNLSRSGRATVVVYDLQGRIVARLLDRTLEAGEHRITWNGRGRSGSPLRAGVYFCRLHSLEGTLVRRMLLAR